MSRENKEADVTSSEDVVYSSKELMQRIEAIEKELYAVKLKADQAFAYIRSMQGIPDEPEPVKSPLEK